MLKAKRLQKGDKVAIVSLSGGMLGEDFCSHYLDIGRKNLESFGLEVVFMPNALKGMEYVKKYPQKRASDLKEAFLDESIKGIICAIGGVDTFRTVPYLLDDEEFISAVQTYPKLFTGFSDTTINHLMFYKLGLSTFYGANYICDFSEVSGDMLNYTKTSVKNYYLAQDVFAPICPSLFWYEERSDFSKNAIGTSRIKHEDTKGYELIQGLYPFEGELLGGCLESLGELVLGQRYSEQKIINEKYQLFPSCEQWKDKILFIETSEEKPNEEKYRAYLQVLKSLEVFSNIIGIIHSKPQDEIHYEMYKKILIEEVDNPDLPIVYNVNFGHSYPRTVLAYGLRVKVSSNCIQYLEECVL